MCYRNVIFTIFMLYCYSYAKFTNEDTDFTDDMLKNQKATLA